MTEPNTQTTMMICVCKLSRTSLPPPPPPLGVVGEGVGTVSSVDTTETTVVVVSVTAAAAVVPSAPVPVPVIESSVQVDVSLLLSSVLLLTLSLTPTLDDHDDGVEKDEEEVASSVVVFIGRADGDVDDVISSIGVEAVDESSVDADAGLLLLLSSRSRSALSCTNGVPFEHVADATTGNR